MAIFFKVLFSEINKPRLCKTMQYLKQPLIIISTSDESILNIILSCHRNKNILGNLIFILRRLII